MENKKLVFRQKNGLTQYALACGYIQRVEATVNGRNIRVDLWHEGACYHARAHDFTESVRLAWESDESLVKAREHWDDLIWEHFGNALKEIAKDKRYSYSREFHGESDPSFITRFCGDWVGKSETPSGAMMNAYMHNAGRLNDAN